MKSLKHVLRSGLLLLGLCFSVFSCDMFQHSIPQYLKNYTEQILAGEITPCSGMPFERASDGTYIIPSTLDEDYCFSFYYNDPQDRPNIFLFYENPSDPDNPVFFPSQDGTSDFYSIHDTDNSLYKIGFKSSYLKEKDRESSDRNINFKLIFQYSDEPTPSNSFKIGEFNFNCIVNTPPEILEDNYTYCKLIVDGVKRNILCFNIKPEEENLYGDLKNSNGNYTIKINGTTYEFYFDTTTHKPVFLDTNHFFSSLSSIPNSSGLETPEGGFETKTNPVYFVTNENTEKLYEILIVDNHGLEKKYTISTKPSGKQKLKLSVSEGIDFIEITPDFTAVPQKEGETPITVNNLTLVYKIDDGEAQEHSIPDSTPFTIYVPGGTERINYYMKTDQPDINQSEHKETKFTLQKKIYVKPTPEDSNYRGGTSKHPWNIKDALEYLGHQTGEWTLDVGSWEYIADASDITNEDNVNTFLYVKLRDNQESLKIYIEGNSNTQRATFNANGKGRVFYPNGVQIYLKNVNITGGVAANQGGGGITTNTSLTLENCDIQGNKATYVNQSGDGGGIFKNHQGRVYIKNCKIYNNESAKEGGGICVDGGENTSPEVVIENTQIYGNKSGTSGGGIYNNYGDIYIYGGSIIGTASNNTAQYTENSGKYSNRAAANGGGICSLKGSINIGYYLDEEQELTGDDDDTNSIVYNSASSGGGIYCNQAVVRMYNGSIDYNYADGDGGGVYLLENSSGDISKFHIQTSLMRYNEANTTGGAVYVQGKNKTEFIPMGTVSIESSGAKKNDVYLNVNGNAIKLNSTPGLNSNSNITITPQSYDTTPKLKDDDAGVIAQKYKCFSVTKSGNTEYFLNPKAVLTTYQPAETLPSDYSVSSGDTIYVWSGADITRIAALSKNYDFTGATVKLLDNIQTRLRREGNDQIGSSEKPFNGVFDGNNKEIDCSNNTKAIFYFTGGSAVIKDLKLTGSVTLERNTDFATYNALLIGQMIGGKIQNCTNYCSLTISNISNVSIGALVSTAKESSDQSACAELDRCINYAYVNVTSTEDDYCGCVGVLVGSSAGCNFTNCAQRNYVKGGTYSGGLLGKFTRRSGNTTASMFKNCYVSANVESTISGGFAGGITNSHNNPLYSVSFINCYYMGTLTTNNGSSGIFVGNDYGDDPNPTTLSFTHCIFILNVYNCTGNASYEPYPENGYTIKSIVNINSTITSMETYLNQWGDPDICSWQNLNNNCVFDYETQ